MKNKAMKKFLSILMLVLFVIISPTVKASPVDTTMVKIVACNFFRSVDEEQARSPLNARIVYKASEPMTQQLQQRVNARGVNDALQRSSEVVYFYVIEMDPDGWVMVSADDRRLDDGHQSHIRIGGDHDRADIIGAEFLCHDDRGGTVCRADDGDGCSVVEIKEHRCKTKREENTELRRRAKEHEQGIGKQRTKVDHSTDTDKQNQRE